MAVSPIEQVLLLHAAADKTPSIASLVKAMAAHNRTFMKDGKPASPEETRVELEAALTAFRRERLPIYRRLGVN
jgi:hypothetical protein